MAEPPRGTDCHPAGFTEKEQGREAKAGCLHDRMIKNNAVYWPHKLITFQEEKMAKRRAEMMAEFEAKVGQNKAT